jgi:hypothetical protein
MKARRIVSRGPVGGDLTVAVEAGVHVSCPGRQASRMGSSHVERWPVGRHPCRGHRPGHFLYSLPAVRRQRATNTSRPKYAASAVVARLGALQGMVRTTPIEKAVDQTPKRSVPLAKIWLWPDHTAMSLPPVPRPRLRTDRSTRGHRRRRDLPFTRRRHPRRNDTEPRTGIGDPRPASTQRRPAVVSCSDQRIELDPVRGGERRCPPPHITAHAMGGDPARRGHRFPAAVWGTPATSVSASGGSPIGGRAG